MKRGYATLNDGDMRDAREGRIRGRLLLLLLCVWSGHCGRLETAVCYTGRAYKGNGVARESCQTHIQTQTESVLACFGNFVSPISLVDIWILGLLCQGWPRTICQKQYKYSRQHIAKYVYATSIILSRPHVRTLPPNLFIIFNLPPCLHRSPPYSRHPCISPWSHTLLLFNASCRWHVNVHLPYWWRQLHRQSLLRAGRA